MIKHIYETAGDLHIRGTMIYIKGTPDGYGYSDPEFKNKVTPDFLINAFNMGTAIIADVEKNAYYKVVSMKATKSQVTLTYLTSDTDLAAVTLKSVEVPVLSISANSDTPILGKTISDLQSNIKIDNVNKKITGTLKYVEGFTEFNASDPTEQKGNYLFINLKDSMADKITSVLVGGKSGKEVDCTTDKWMMYWITSSCTAIKLKLTKGTEVVEETYDITELVLNPKR